MSSPSHNEEIVAFYTKRLQQFGTDPRSLDWGSAKSQELRFAVLQQIGDWKGKSLLDVGCGLGDLYGYLQNQQIQVDYTGYDITPAMVEAAQQRFPHVEFAVKDILSLDQVSPQFDYVVASGIFYLVQTAPMIFVEKMVRRMFALSRVGAAFNTLSTQASQQDPGEFYADPAEMLRLCLAISPRVIIRHDYLPHDFTVYIYR